MKALGLLGMGLGVLLLLSGVFLLFDMNPLGWWFDLIFSGGLIVLGSLLYSLSRTRMFKAALYPAASAKRVHTSPKNAPVLAAGFCWILAILSFAGAFMGGHTSQALTVNGILFATVGFLFIFLRK